MYEESGKRPCYSCEDFETQIDSAKDYLKDVIKELYSMDRLNENELESALDNLCHILGVKMPEIKIQVVRRLQPEHILNDWVIANNKYLRSLVP